MRLKISWWTSLFLGSALEIRYGHQRFVSETDASGLIDNYLANCNAAEHFTSVWACLCDRHVGRRAEKQHGFGHRCRTRENRFYRCHRIWEQELQSQWQAQLPLLRMLPALRSAPLLVLLMTAPPKHLRMALPLTLPWQFDRRRMRGQLLLRNCRQIVRGSSLFAKHRLASLVERNRMDCSVSAFVSVTLKDRLTMDSFANYRESLAESYR